MGVTMKFPVLHGWSDPTMASDFPSDVREGAMNNSPFNLEHLEPFPFEKPTTFESRISAFSNSDPYADCLGSHFDAPRHQDLKETKRVENMWNNSITNIDSLGFQGGMFFGGPPLEISDLKSGSLFKSESNSMLRGVSDYKHVELAPELLESVLSLPESFSTGSSNNSARHKRNQNRTKFQPGNPVNECDDTTSVMSDLQSNEVNSGKKRGMSVSKRKRSSVSCKSPVEEGVVSAAVSPVLMDIGEEKFDKDTVPVENDANPADKKGKRRKKDKDAPRKGRSAFILFLMDFRNANKQENNSAKAFSNVSKKVGAAWTNLSDRQRAKYIQEAANEAAEYKKKKQEYLASKQEKELEKVDAGATETEAEAAVEDGLEDELAAALKTEQ